MSAHHNVTELTTPSKRLLDGSVEASHATMSGPDPRSVESKRPTGAKGVGKTVGGWLLLAVVGVLVVLYALSPIFQQRDQHRSLTKYKVSIREASLENTGLYGYTLPTQPPKTGSTVGILEIGQLKLQDAVAEGVGPAQTETGPGHVPGTAGLGQPGNSAIVARRAVFGSPFSQLSSLRKGASVVVTTQEGQSLYVVQLVKSLDLKSASPASVTVPNFGATASTGPVAPTTLGSSVDVDDLLGPSSDNRLTLVTSGSLLPWNSTRATVVIAALKTLPFEPTPQQARSSNEDGRGAQSDALALVVLALIAFGAVAVGATVAYRRCAVRSAYLLSTAPIIVVSIWLAVAVCRSLPAWA